MSPSSRICLRSRARHVLVRTDYNVPMSGGRITDDLRIRLSLETLTWLLDQGAARVTTASHLGRPEGPARSALRHGAGPAATATSCWTRHGADAGRVECCENLRFDPREEAGDLSLRRGAGRRARTSSSTTRSGRPTGPTPRSSGPPRLLPSAAGRAMAREVEVLGGLLHGAGPPVCRRARWGRR